MDTTVPRAVRRRVESHEDLEVYRLAFSAACRIFQLSKSFPREETYSLTDQICRASRAVCTGISEAWRRRRYQAAFVNKLNEAESEAAETQTWCAFAVECGYWQSDQGRELREIYDKIIGKLVNMINDPYPWLLAGKDGRQKA
jgi:four helix bundle protein